MISELIKQKVLENKKSAHGDSFRIIAEVDAKNLERLTFINPLKPGGNKMVTHQALKGQY